MLRVSSSTLSTSLSSSRWGARTFTVSCTAAGAEPESSLSGMVKAKGKEELMPEISMTYPPDIHRGGESNFPSLRTDILNYAI